LIDIFGAMVFPKLEVFE